MALSIASGVTGALGSIYSGTAEAYSKNYQAGLADMNAKIARQDANYAISQGETEAEVAARRVAHEVAGTRVAIASQNISLSTGSAPRVVSSEIALGQQTQGIIRANAAKRAYGFEIAALGDDAQAKLDRMGAGAARAASTFGAFSSILGGIAGGVSDVSKATTAGVPTGQAVLLG